MALEITETSRWWYARIVVKGKLWRFRLMEKRGGMSEELVRRVTGHTAVEVMRRHYFKPGREEFRREFEKAMPALLMSGANSRDEQLREIIGQMTPKTWKRDKARLLELLKKDS